LGFADEDGEAGEGEGARDVVNDVDLAKVQAGLQGLQRHVHLEDHGFALGSGHFVGHDGLGFVDLLAYRRNVIARHAHIRTKPRRAGAVHDAAVGDQDVEACGWRLWTGHLQVQEELRELQARDSCPSRRRRPRIANRGAGPG